MRIDILLNGQLSVIDSTKCFTFTCENCEVEVIIVAEPRYHRCAQIPENGHQWEFVFCPQCGGMNATEPGLILFEEQVLETGELATPRINPCCPG